MASSEYLQREEAAKKQLGKKGVAKRAKQLPRAARATARGLLREVTGIDVSRKGVSVIPENLAMALPVGKLAKAAVLLRNAGKISEANALFARVSSKAIGGSAKAERALEQFGLELKGESASKIFAKANKSRILEAAPKAWKKITGPKGEITLGSAARESSESLFPRLPSGGGVPGAKRTFDQYYDALGEGASRFVGKDDLNAFVSDAGKLGGMRKVGRAALKAKNATKRGR